MIRTLIYGILLGTMAYTLLVWRRVINNPFASTKSYPKSRQRFRTPTGREPWIQVYETSSSEDAYLIQARLQEEEVECVIYEQGKKDIQGNSLKGFGIAVPKSSLPLAQKVISRMPV